MKEVSTLSCQEKIVVWLPTYNYLNLDTRLVLAKLFPLHFEAALFGRAKSSADPSSGWISACPGPRAGGPALSPASSPIERAEQEAVTLRH